MAADNKRYYYLKLKENFFDSEEMIILQSMQDGYIYSDILMKLYLRSLKNNGKLMFKDVIPYTPEILATTVRHQVGTVEKALKIFKQLGLVEVLDNGAIYMMDIQNFIGESSTEADRIRLYRSKIEKEKDHDIKSISDGVQMYNKCSNKSTTENRDKSIENRDKRIEKERINYQEIINLYNEVCTSFPKVMSISDKRRQAIKARLNKYSREDFKRLFEKAEESDFLKGSNSRNWQANFDWLIKDANMAKVLDGNYENREVIREKAQELDYSEGWD